MTSLEVASTTNYFIATFRSVLQDNIGIVLTFAAGIIVWFILKKWVFGGARRV